MRIVHVQSVPISAEAARALLRPGGLQDQADELLRRRLAGDPRNTDTLWELAEIHRRQGNFAAARSLLAGCLRGRGSDSLKAAWLHAMLSGNGAPEPAPGGIRPAPFVRMTNFLAPGECDRLLALGLAAREQLAPAKVGSDERLDPEVRVNLEICDRRTEKEIRLQIAPKVRSLVPEILARLRMDGIGRCSIEMSMRVYLDRGFYRAHSDNYSESHRRRKLSFVYFIHREPRRFSGGDLLLHDTDTDEKAYSPERFSRIVPLRNSIVFFPCGYSHQVTPVQCGTDDFGDGRWAVNGHVSPSDREEAAYR